MLGTRALVLLVLALGGGSRVDAQLLAGVKQFLGTLPTFYSVDRSTAPRPATPGPSGAPDVNLLAVATNATALMDSLLSVPVNSTTHEWQVTDLSLGAGLAFGPSGATVLTRDPMKGQDAYEQTLRLGPDGVVLGPNKASAQVNRTADLAQGTLGIDNLHLGPNGVLINNGSPLNSSVKVTQNGLMVQGNPTGSGLSHFFVKPNLRLGTQQVLGQAANGSLNNVQISLGDTNKTAGEQMSGFHSYELHGNGSVGAASNATLANPYFATNTAGKASVWGPASAPVRSPYPVPLAAAPSATALAVQAGSLPQRFGGVRGSDAGTVPAADAGASGSLQSAPQAASAEGGGVGQGAVAQSAGEILPSHAAASPVTAGQGIYQGLDRGHALRQDGRDTAPEVHSMQAGAGSDDASAQHGAGRSSTSASTPTSSAGRRRLRGWRPS